MDHLRVRRLNPDGLTFDDDLLLFRCLEVPLFRGSSAKVLYGSHDIVLLGQIGVSKFPRLVELIAHREENVGVMTE